MTTPHAPARCRGDRGSVMPMATVLVIFLMIGAWALVSASQQWNMRREVHAVAAAAARAGAQSDPDTLRAGAVLDPAAATRRAQAILAASGYSGAVTVDGIAVTVTVTGSVAYAFPSPGFPDQRHRHGVRRRPPWRHRHRRRLTMPRRPARLRSLAALALLAAITVGIPVLLIAIAGWPLPRQLPDWDRVRIAIQQGDIPAEVVINTLAVIVWIAWAQLVWALGWELAVNLPRAQNGEPARPAPLVPAAVAGGVGRLVAVLFAVGLTVATTPTPTLARPAVPAALVETPAAPAAAPPPPDRAHAPRRRAGRSANRTTCGTSPNEPSATAHEPPRSSSSTPP